MAEDQKQPDWLAIEKDYRAGLKSLRQIAGEHGITEGAIRKRATKEEWPRDLKKKIREKADELVRKDAVRSEVRKASEGEVVDSNAEIQANVRRKHRKDISALMEMVAALLAELGVVTANKEAFEQAIALMLEQDQQGAAIAMQKAISLPVRAGTLEKLVNCMAKLVPLEREAFGIDDKAKDESPLEKLLREVSLSEASE